MNTLSSLKSLIRRDLKDEDSANYHWTDDEIDTVIYKVLADYHLEHPLTNRQPACSRIIANAERYLKMPSDMRDYYASGGREYSEDEALSE